ncbi:hypothetical protein JXL83_07845 [candidate division WOR-3 bacterium]|nr:hypothetical protein [candidate division WOR-3 bacterium]
MKSQKIRQSSAVRNFFRKTITGEILFSGKRADLGHKYNLLKQAVR